MPDEYDSPWKEALEVFLRPMLEFCFPLVATAIDWSVPPVFMDKELQEIAGDSALGRQTVDKLVRVELLDGREEWAWCTSRCSTNGTWFTDYWTG